MEKLRYLLKFERILKKLFDIFFMFLAPITKDFSGSRMHYSSVQLLKQNFGMLVIERYGQLFAVGGLDIFRCFDRIVTLCTPVSG